MQTSIFSRIDKTVSFFGDKILFYSEERNLSFSEFDNYSKAIATFLCKKILPGNPVVVLSGRHVLTPCAFVGVARAGCFYAPLEADVPVSRMNSILDVIHASCMICDREHEELAHSLSYKGDIFILEDLLNTTIDNKLLEKNEETLTLDSPLYVIFTSGSSGKPKGVITSSLSLMCYIDAIAEVLEITPEDIMGNQSPLDYIAAIRDIYFPLFFGCSNVLLPKSQFAMPTALFETLNKYKVTTLCWSVSGVELPAKLDAFEEVKPEFLKKLCFSGSVINSRYLRLWQQNLPDVKFVNQYGPTETTASCTYQVIDFEVMDNSVLPIGKPFNNYNIFLLSEDNKAVPQGEIGEICVSGPALALGYYGDVERTKQSFMQNPLNSNYFERIYKTGDLGHMDDNGVLYYHGRKDRQVKHMGHRIELGEIEATALQIEGVEQCSALYYQDKELLYLFYVGEADNRTIIKYFRSVLPGYMAPRKVIKLKVLPVLPNGKIDLQSLKAMF